MFEVGFMYKNKLGARVRTCFLEVLFKGSVLQDFLSLFFHDSNPPGRLTNSLKYFRIIYRVRQNTCIRIFLKFHGMYPTAMSISAV